MACYQGQRSWSPQLVAGRPHSAAGSNVLSSSCDTEATTCKRTCTGLMRAPPGSTPKSYTQSLADNFVSFPLIADGDHIDIDVHPMYSTRDLVDYLVDFSSQSPFISDVAHDFDDSEDSDSDTDVESDSDAEAQYITIPPESPWWKAPPKSSSDNISFDTLVDDEVDFEDAPSNHSLEEVLQKQQYLVGVFHDELRRMVPPGAYDDTWLREVDAKLLLAPVEAFEEACMSSMSISSKSSPTDFDCKAFPDVPIDLDEGDEDQTNDDLEEWEWEYPCYAQRVNLMEAHPHLDHRFIAHLSH